MSYAYAYRYRCIFPRGAGGPPFPNPTSVIQWLGVTFQDTDSKYYQEDKIGDETRELRDGGVGQFNGVDHKIDFITDTSSLTSVTLDVRLKLSKNNAILIYDPLDTAKWFFLAIAGDVSTISVSGGNVIAGYTASIDGTVFQNGVDTRNDVYNILVDGNYHTIKIENVNLSNWSSVSIGLRTSFFFGGFIDYFKCDTYEFYMESGSGTNVFNIAEGGINAILEGTEATFWGTDPLIYSQWNSYGGNINAGVYVPARLPSYKIDALGDAVTDATGKVKKNITLQTRTFESNGIDNYGNTGYFPIEDSVVVMKGRYLVATDAKFIGALDSTNGRRFYFQITGGNWNFGWGSGNGSNGTADTELHTFIMYSGKCWILPISTDISSKEKVKDIIDNVSPDINTGTIWGTVGASEEDFYLGAVNLNLSALNFSNFQNLETYILEYDGIDIVDKHKWTHDSVNSRIDYDKIGLNHITWTGTYSQVNQRPFSAYQRPNSLLDGCDIWDDGAGNIVEVGFDINGNSVKTDGDVITGYTWDRKIEGTLEGHNGCHTIMYQPYDYELYTVSQAFTVNPWYSGTTPIAIEYDTISYDYEIAGYWFADIVSKSHVKFNWLVYNVPQSGDDLISVYLKMNTIEVLQTSEGEDLEASDGKLYVYKESIL